MSFIHDLRRSHALGVIVYPLAFLGTILTGNLLWVILTFLFRAILVLWHTEDEADDGFVGHQAELFGYRAPRWVERLVFYHGLRAQLIGLLALSAFGVEWAEAAFCAAVGADAIVSHFGPSIVRGEPNAGTIPTAIVYLLLALVALPVIVAHPIASGLAAGQFVLIWVAVAILGQLRPTPKYAN